MPLALCTAPLPAHISVTEQTRENAVGLCHRTLTQPEMCCARFNTAGSHAGFSPDHGAFTKYIPVYSLVGMAVKSDVIMVVQRNPLED